MKNYNIDKLDDIMDTILISRGISYKPKIELLPLEKVEV